MKKIKELLMKITIFWNQFKTQFYTWSEAKQNFKKDWNQFRNECIQAWNIVKQDFLNAWYFLKKKCIWFYKKLKRISIKSILWKIYKKIDRGNPSWLSLLKRIKLTIPIKNISKKRRKWKFLKGFLPDYIRVDTDNFVFLFTDEIPKNSNAILEVKKIKALMLDNGFKKVSKITNTENTNSFRCDYTHDIYKTVYVFVYMDDKCDIEYIDVVKQEPIVTGMCAKILEELNSN